MERRKTHAQAQLHSLNKECEITNDLLNKLQQMCSKHVNQIDDKNVQLTSKHLVAIFKFQSESMQKLMEWNIGLEKILAEMEPEDLSHDTLTNGTNDSTSSEYQNSLPVTCYSSEPAVKGTEGVIDLYDIYFGAKANRKKHKSTINSEKVKIYKKGKGIPSDSGSIYMPYMTETESMLVVNEIKPDPEKDDEGNISLDKDIEKEPIEIGVHSDLNEINESFDANLSIAKVLVQNDTESIESFNGEENLVKIKDPSYDHLDRKKEIPESNPLKIGDKCTIGFAQTPSEIYIQVTDSNNSLDVLSMQLLEEYLRTPTVYTPKKIAAREYGNFWISRLKNVPCRVEVIDWLLNVKTDTVLVHMIDYGWKRWMNYHYLKVLNTNLRNIPRMAQLCHFGHLYPPGSTIEERKQTWPLEVCNQFYGILGNLDETYYRIVRACYCKERKSYDIDLIKIDEEHKENTIGQLLIEFEVAVEIFDDNSGSNIYIDKK